MELRCDYLVFTVFGEGAKHGLALWDYLFKAHLGDLVHSGHGSRWYRDLYVNSTGAVLSCNPTQPSKKHGFQYYTIELKGSSCKCLTPDVFRSLAELRAGGLNVRCGRVDWAFDDVPFTVEDVWEQLIGGSVKTWAKRESFKVIDSPYEKDEMGQEGTKTVYVGSLKRRDRIVRIYDLHGFTRLELEMRNRWADNTVWLVFGSPFGGWHKAVVSILLDYLTFPEWSNWQAWVEDVTPAGIKIFSARVVSLQRIKNWIERQVAPAMVALLQAEGEDFDLELWLRSCVTPDRLKRYSDIVSLGY